MRTVYKKIKELIKKNNYLYNFFISARLYVLSFFNKITNYQSEKKRFYKRMGYPLNLNNPQSYNEKIIWKKIYDRNPLLPITADKYLVRSYIKKILGEKQANEILIPLLYVTDKPERIPFAKLPPSFIIKPNHASGRKIIVENGDYNKEEIIRTCQEWLKRPFGLKNLEWAYQSIKRKIIIEELLHERNGKNPYEIKFHMFHGKCKLVQVGLARMNNPPISFFDEEWNYLPVKSSNIPQEQEIRKPKNYEIMLELAEKLSKSFDYIRIDLYNLNGRVYFGELTHYPGSGVIKLEPNSFAFELGKFWKIERGYWEKN